MSRRNRNSGPTPWWLVLIELVAGLGGLWFIYIVSVNALNGFMSAL